MISIKKEVFDTLVIQLLKDNEVVAPVQREESRFEIIKNKNDLSKIHMDEHSYYPAKKFLFRKDETLVEFKNGKATVPALNTKTRIMMGLKRCDLNAIKRQDMIFKDHMHDPYYMAQRDNTILIGFQCQESPSQFCFCESMNLEDYHDIMIYDRGKYYLVEVGSLQGDDFVHKYKRFFESSDDEVIEDDRHVENHRKLEKKDISQYYDHENWKKEVDICLSCAACVTMCPTCYCFDICDEPDIKDLGNVKRKRNWASCQLTCFTKVAGGHVFRKDREGRFKHRIYHQLQYFREKHGINLCVGCGRCIRGCPTRIDFLAALNSME